MVLGNAGARAERAAAWEQFFGDKDPRPVEYWPGTGERITRERRFLGYFLYRCLLPSGERPVEAAARARFDPPFLDEVLASVRHASYALGSLKSIVGRSCYLQVGEEELEVR